ncbi:hypothetical protein FRC08_006048 [Ceratobasidium sp. 394]|nr:hypothetical protein FRC08_006048 [Ceratobasidium sp. 394]
MGADNGALTEPLNIGDEIRAELDAGKEQDALVRTHGLGAEYRREICSDHVYMGRKSFDRHFQESRHAFGMCAPRLPNVARGAADLTDKTNDVLYYNQKLSRTKRQNYVPQQAVENEDGHVNQANYIREAQIGAKREIRKKRRRERRES